MIPPIILGVKTIDEMLTHIVRYTLWYSSANKIFAVLRRNSTIYFLCINMIHMCDKISKD